MKPSTLHYQYIGKLHVKLYRNWWSKNVIFATVQKRWLVAKNAFSKNPIIFCPIFWFFNKDFCQTLLSKVIAIFSILKKVVNNKKKIVYG